MMTTVVGGLLWAFAYFATDWCWKTWRLLTGAFHDAFRSAACWFHTAHRDADNVVLWLLLFKHIYGLKQPKNIHSNYAETS